MILGILSYLFSFAIIKELIKLIKELDELLVRIISLVGWILILIQLVK